MKFWAKTGNGDHLSVDRHLHDTGAVALRLFDHALGSAQRRWVAASLAIELALARQFVWFVVAAHDIAKIGPFQHQVPELAQRLGSASLPDFLGARPRHDLVGGVLLHRFVRERGGSEALAGCMAAMISGHHGVPRAITRADRRSLVGLETWTPHQEEQLARLACEAGFESFAGIAAPPDGVVLALAGLVSAADWIASDARRFPVASGPRRPSGELARDAVAVAAWSSPPRPVTASFDATFEFAPRATQRAVIDALDGIELPALLIVEDRTGSGKTEAALWAARVAIERGARGLYVGLPTRATARQVHRRTRGFLRAVWPELDDRALRLLHGGVHLTDDDPDPSGVDELGAGDAAAREWFAGPRRGLLAPNAVGTIDQALLGVLAVRFFAVRLWGLAGKVVVLDEVHAYDDYTGELLQSLAGWLGALGCTVVLLSATLPRARRDALVEAYRNGLGSPLPSARGDSNSLAAYPRLTLATASAVRVEAVVDDRPGRRIELEHHRISESADAVAALVSHELREGGCLAVVCSTVGLAQERFQAIRRALPGPDDVVLLHARMRPVEREPVETELLDRLGPGGDRRPRRLVVVATQIIEQSLDLDFDVVLSDLAPIDLLVQRAGRAHRHAGRERPEPHRRPRLLVLDAPAGAAREHGLPSGAAAVYVHAVLERTRAVLAHRTAIDEPGDLDELIGEVYGDDVPRGISEEHRERIARLDVDARTEARQRRDWARQNGIPVPNRDDRPWEERQLPIADGDTPGAMACNAAATRWADRPSVDIVVLRADEARLAAEPLRSATVRELLRRAVSVSTPGIVARVVDEPELHRPPGWSHSGALRHHVLAVVGRTDLPIDWDPVLGVIV